jgi:hypothetical protein
LKEEKNMGLDGAIIIAAVIMALAMIYASQP